MGKCVGRQLNIGRTLLMLLALSTAAVGLRAQTAGTASTPSGPVEFDAASVKPSNPNSTSGTVVSASSGRLHVANATVKDLIETAYDVRSFQIEEGPKWVDSTKYDVDATTAPPRGATIPPSGWDNVRVEVQALLKDRFQLQVHRETKIGSVYSLAIAKGGVKSSTLLSTQNPHRGINAGKGTMVGEAASMTDLTSKLSRLLGRPVVNNTGLEGNYDFKLEWTPDSGSSAPDEQSADTPIGGSLFTALQEQLGLRLEATKGPVDVLVIDHVDKPSEN
jgi:uncharacterized protein (TIGR03435 family)